jgi:hypothetical protein
MSFTEDPTPHQVLITGEMKAVIVIQREGKTYYYVSPSQTQDKSRKTQDIYHRDTGDFYLEEGGRQTLISPSNPLYEALREETEEASIRLKQPSGNNN